MVETFFKTIKSELAWRIAFSTRAQAGQAVATIATASAIPSGHSALDYTSPAQLERTASR
ncbi:MAG: hypothetical protein J0H41_05805 [Rhizobiales bacterium]|nr:hypothetical protein [Hyphomicrobiales bacterium]